MFSGFRGFTAMAGSFVPPSGTSTPAARDAPPIGGGGDSPVWSRDGKEIFYRAGERMMAARITATRGVFEASRPQELFVPRRDARLSRQFEVSPDGQGFLMLRSHARDWITIVVNFAAELERLARESRGASAS